MKALKIDKQETKSIIAQKRLKTSFRQAIPYVPNIRLIFRNKILAYRKRKNIL